MRVLAPAIPRVVIDEEIRAAAFPGHEPARWALPLLDAVERRSGGWSRVALEDEEFASLWLPEHAGEPCHGDTLRIGDAAGGMPLRTAAAWLERHESVFASANPSCWGRISQAAREPRSPIVLAPFGVGDRLKPSHAALVVIDGLHRALGFWLAGDRRCEAYVPFA